MHQFSPPQTLASVYGDFDRKSDDRTTESLNKLKSISSPKSYSTRNEMSSRQPQYRKILSHSMCNLRTNSERQQFTSRSERQQISDHTGNHSNQEERDIDRHRRRQMQRNDYDVQLRDDSASEHPFRMRNGGGSDKPKPKSRKRSHNAQHARCESARASTPKRRDGSRGQFDCHYNSDRDRNHRIADSPSPSQSHPAHVQSQSLQSRRPIANRHGTEHESASRKRKPNRRNCSARTRSQFDYNPNPNQNAGRSIRMDRIQNHKPKRELRHTRSISQRRPRRHSRSDSQRSQQSMGERAQSQRPRTRQRVREWHESELPAIVDDSDSDREVGAESSLLRELCAVLAPLQCELSNLRGTTRELQHQVSVLKYQNHLHRLLIRGADIADPRSPRRDTVSPNHGIGGALSADTIDSIEKRFSPSHPSRGGNQIELHTLNLQNQQSRPHSGIGNAATAAPALIPRPRSPQPRYSFLSHSVRRSPRPPNAVTSTSPRVISMEAQPQSRDDCKHILIQNDEMTDTDYEDIEDIERIISASHYTQKMEEDGFDLDSKLSKLRLQRLTMELDDSQLFDGQRDAIDATTANSTRCNGNVTTADASPPFPSPTLTRSVPQSRYKYEHTVL